MLLWLLSCSRATRDLSRSVIAAEGTMEEGVAVGNRTAREVLSTELFTISGDSVTLYTLISVIVVGLLTLLISRLARRAATAALKRRGVADEGRIGVTRRLLHYGVLVIGFSVAMEILGIRLSSLFAAGAIFAVGIGFAMQTIAQNFVAGVILLVERSIRPRDVLEVDGRVVRVEEMGLRSTIVRTWDDEDLIVPNRLLSENAVKNFTSRDRLCRVACSVGVSYDSDMALVERVLFEAGASLEGRVIEKNPVVLLTGFGDSAVNWRVHVWTNRPWTQPKVRSDLNKSVWWALKRAGIEIPFPQVDVHVDTPPKERLLG